MLAVEELTGWPSSFALQRLGGPGSAGSGCKMQAASWVGAGMSALLHVSSRQPMTLTAVKVKSAHLYSDYQRLVFLFLSLGPFASSHVLLVGPLPMLTIIELIIN